MNAAIYLPVVHPQTLLKAGKATASSVFTHNQLCLSVTPKLATKKRSWLSPLFDPSLRRATSTPQRDPCGDYTWQLFDGIEGKPAAAWLLNGSQADMFIGYHSYASQLAVEGSVVCFSIPSPWQIKADYACAHCSENGAQLASFLLSPQAQRLFLEAGFSQ